MLVYFLFFLLGCYPVQYVASVRLFASRFNPLGALQQVAQLALTPQQGEPYQQDQYAANPPTAPAPELPSSSVSREEIQAMESGAGTPESLLFFIANDLRCTQPPHPNKTSSWTKR